MSIRWGLIGYGDLAEKRVANALKESGELCAIWGRNKERSESFASRHNIPRCCSSLEHFLNEGLDAVYICTPPDSHAELAVAAAGHGKHVLVEKPMASSVPECEQMLKAAESNNIVLGIAYYRRAFPKMLHVRNMIERGELGLPVWVNIACHSWFSPSIEDPKHWRVEKAKSGGAGALADIGVHRLDLLDYWLPGSEMISANFGNLVHGYEVEDVSSIFLKLSAGAPVHAYFSWNSKTWMDRFEIVGSEAKLVLEPLDDAAMTIIRGRERESILFPVPDNAHLPCVKDFVDACKKGGKALSDGKAGLRVNKILDQAIAKAGR